MLLAFLLTLPDFPTQDALGAATGISGDAVSKALSGKNGLTLHNARVYSVLASRHGHDDFADAFGSCGKRLLPAPETAKANRSHLDEMDAFMRGGGAFGQLFLERRYREARQYLHVVLSGVWSGLAELDQAEADERAGRPPIARRYGAEQLHPSLQPF